MNVKKTYSKYDSEVIEYMENLIRALEKQYGQIDDEWRVSLDLIASDYNIIKQCQKDIEKFGFTKTDDRGRLARNPCISIYNQTQGHLMKLLSQFGLNIMSKSRLKGMRKDSDGLEELLA